MAFTRSHDLLTFSIGLWMLLAHSFANEYNLNKSRSSNYASFTMITMYPNQESHPKPFDKLPSESSSNEGQSLSEDEAY